MDNQLTPNISTEPPKHTTTCVDERLTLEQIRIHYSQLPAIIIAPLLGGLFSSWVLWNAVNNNYLIIGMAGIFTISLLRVFLYRSFLSSPEQQLHTKKWRNFAISGALISGIIWGSAAIFLYPPLNAEYQIFLLVLLALVPVAPIAAMAVYMPAFYAYYIPCITPYILTLAFSDNIAAQMTALLLIMMLGATINFAHQYSKTLKESLRLKLQLSDKTKMLEHAAQVKTQFMAAASHDLRQPTHAIGLFTESLRKGISDEQNAILLKNIDTSLQGLRSMLNEMLDISRLDADVVSINSKCISTGEFLHRLYTEYAPLAKEKNLQLRIHIHDEMIYSDPTQLERILRNLLSNAIKYTAEGGILLSCRKRQENIIIQVYDTGSGIPNDQLDNIFLEFTQINNPARDASQGLGLGLAITKRLCQLLGVELNVRSRIGHGSVFTLKIKTEDSSPNNTDHRQEISPSGHTSPPQNLSILVIDDNAQVRASMASLLESWGNRVLHADSAETAIAQLGKKPTSLPDIMLIDYRLSANKTALDAINLLNKTFDKKIPTIIITGDTDPARIREAHDSGLMLLHKPISPDRLAIGINFLLS